MTKLSWLVSKEGSLKNRVAFLKKDDEITILAVLRGDTTFAVTVLNSNYSFLKLKDIPYRSAYEIAKSHFSENASDDEKERITLGTACYIVEKELKQQLESIKKIIS